MTTPVALYTPAQRERFRKRLLLFYSTHDPEGSGRISNALTLRVPEPTVMAGLYSKYNVSFEQEETAARAKGLLPESAGAGSGSSSPLSAHHRGRSQTYTNPTSQQQQQQHMLMQQMQSGVFNQSRRDSIASRSSSTSGGGGADALGGMDPATFGALQQSFGNLSAQSSFAFGAAAAAGIGGGGGDSDAAPGSLGATIGPDTNAAPPLVVVANLPEHEKVRVRRRVERFYENFFPAGAWKVHEAMSSTLPEAELIESLCSSYKVDPKTELKKAAELALPSTEDDVKKFEEEKEERFKKQMQKEKERELESEREKHKAELEKAKEEAERIKKMYEQQMKRATEEEEDKKRKKQQQQQDAEIEEMRRKAKKEDEKKKRKAAEDAGKPSSSSSSSDPPKKRNMTGALLSKAKKIQSGEEANPLANFEEGDAGLTSSPSAQKPSVASAGVAAPSGAPSSHRRPLVFKDDSDDDIPPPPPTNTRRPPPQQPTLSVSPITSTATTAVPNENLSPQQQFQRQQQMQRQLAQLQPPPNAPAADQIAFLRSELAAARGYTAALEECHKAEMQEREKELLERLKDKAQTERQLAVESQVSPSRRDLLYGSEGRASTERAATAAAADGQQQQYLSSPFRGNGAAAAPRASAESEQRYRNRLATMSPLKSTPSSPVRVRGHASPEHPLLMICGVCGEAGKDNFCHCCGAAFKGHLVIGDDQKLDNLH